MKQPIGRLRVLEARARAAHGLGDRVDRVRSWLMTSLPELLLHLEEALGFGLVEAVSGMPVILETVSAMTSSSTRPPVS